MILKAIILNETDYENIIEELAIENFAIEQI